MIVIFDLPESIIIRNDNPPSCPSSMRIIEAVVIATLSAVAGRVVEHFYWKLFPPKESAPLEPK